MVRQGDVYFPDANLPPGQDIKHRVIVLSPNTLIAQHGARLFVNVAVIRSATNQRTGRPVPLVMGHSIPIDQTDCPALSHASIVETHQLFAEALMSLARKQPMCTVTGSKLDEILTGARMLFS